jgi:Ion channel
MRGGRLDHRESMRRDRERAGDYGLVLISILVSIVCAASLGRSAWGRLFVATLQGATLILTLRISGARPRTRLVTFVLVTVGVFVAGSTLLFGNPDTSRAIASAVSGLLVVGAPVAIARSAIGHVEVTAQTVMAALSIYLLIGLFFVFAYGVMAAIDSGPFFTSGTDGALPDHVYFSYSTLTTVGFGDLTARGDVGRMTSILEALLGQLYLVTVVAVLVGNLSGRRR